nr:hypothetical protein [Escherichia coli]
EKRVFLVILFTSFSGSLVSRIPGAVQTAQVTLITDEAQNTLLVPIQAVHRNEGKKQQVLVLAADGRLEPRNVKTGITNSVDIQILEGLNVGENVVLSLPDKKEPEERIML